jgi:hypothetical protein
MPYTDDGQLYRARISEILSRLNEMRDVQLQRTLEAARSGNMVDPTVIEYDHQSAVYEMLADAIQVVVEVAYAPIR